MMFLSEISPGFLNVLDFIKLIPKESYLCTTELTGEELIKMIKTVQIGKKGFQLTSGLKGTINIKNKNIKEVINVQIYEDGKVKEFDKNKIYTISSDNFVLSEESKDEFAMKDSLDIIQDKYRNNKIKCSTIKSYVEIMNYFG
jgi:2',3'-cyclic-nucleotide 2'-phosphodiesterase (5'-nucleotidase family)